MEEIVRPSLRHLRIFASVARLKSLHKAAEAVHLSQPAVTLAIKKLETQMGGALFQRRNSGSYLSPAGEILAVRVAHMFDLIETALADFGVRSQGESSLASIAERITRPQMKILAAIAEGRSFADAAQKIGISSGSFHRSLRDLEFNFGRPLIQYTVSGAVTTAAGGSLAARLVLALREIDWAQEEIGAQSGLLRGHLSVGVRPLAGNYLLAPVLNDLKKVYPRAHLQVRTGDGSHLTKSLLLGEIDFIVGFIGTPGDASEIVQEPLISSPYVVVARRDHPLVSKPTITLADLARHEWIAPLPGATRRKAFDGLFQSNSRRLQSDIETYSLSTIQLLLRGSDRLTLLTEFEFEFECERGGEFLVALPFQPIEPVHTVGVSRRRRGTPTPLQQKFLELIRQHAKALDALAPTVAARRATSALPH